MSDVRLGFRGDPVPEEARVIGASVSDLCVVDVYVVNGKSLPPWLAIASAIRSTDLPTPPTGRTIESSPLA